MKFSKFARLFKLVLTAVLLAEISSSYPIELSSRPIRHNLFLSEALSPRSATFRPHWVPAVTAWVFLTLGTAALQIMGSNLPTISADRIPAMVKLDDGGEAVTAFLSKIVDGRLSMSGPERNRMIGMILQEVYNRDSNALLYNLNFEKCLIQIMQENVKNSKPFHSGWRFDPNTANSLVWTGNGPDNISLSIELLSRSRSKSAESYLKEAHNQILGFSDSPSRLARLRAIEAALERISGPIFDMQNSMELVAGLQGKNIQTYEKLADCIRNSKGQPAEVREINIFLSTLSRNNLIIGNLTEALQSTDALMSSSAAVILFHLTTDNKVQREILIQILRHRHTGNFALRKAQVRFDGIYNEMNMPVLKDVLIDVASGNIVFAVEAQRIYAVETLLNAMPEIGTDLTTTIALAKFLADYSTQPQSGIDLAIMRLESPRTFPKIVTQYFREAKEKLESNSKFAAEYPVSYMFRLSHLKWMVTKGSNILERKNIHSETKPETSTLMLAQAGVGKDRDNQHALGNVPSDSWQTQEQQSSLTMWSKWFQSYLVSEFEVLETLPPSQIDVDPARAKDPIWADKTKAFFSDFHKLLSNWRVISWGSHAENVRNAAKLEMDNRILDFDDEVLIPNGWLMIPTFDNVMGFVISKIEWKTPIKIFSKSQMMREFNVWGGRNFEAESSGNKASKWHLIPSGTSKRPLVYEDLDIPQKIFQIKEKIISGDLSYIQNLRSRGLEYIVAAYEEALEREGFVKGHVLSPDYKASVKKKGYEHEVVHVIKVGGPKEKEEALAYLREINHGGGYDTLVDLAYYASMQVIEHPKGMRDKSFDVALQELANATGFNFVTETPSSYEGLLEYLMHLENHYFYLKSNEAEHRLSKELPGPVDWDTEIDDPQQLMPHSSQDRSVDSAFFKKLSRSISYKKIATEILLIRQFGSPISRLSNFMLISELKSKPQAVKWLRVGA